MREHIIYAIHPNRLRENNFLNYLLLTLLKGVCMKSQNNIILFLMLSSITTINFAGRGIEMEGIHWNENVIIQMPGAEILSKRLNSYAKLHDYDVGKWAECSHVVDKLAGKECGAVLVNIPKIRMYLIDLSH